MDCFIMLSEKIWHKSLFLNLKKKFPDKKWIHISKKEDFNYENLLSINPIKIFIPHWSYIISKEIYSHFNCIVFHMTDLPYGRGGSPLQNLIIRGHKTTKISAILVQKGIDTGPVYLKKELSIAGTAQEIFNRSVGVIMGMIKEIIKNSLIPQPQLGEVIEFKRRKPKDSNIIDLKELKDIYDYIRMLDADGYPKAFIENKYFKFEFSNAIIKKGEDIKAEIRIIKK